MSNFNSTGCPWLGFRISLSLGRIYLRFVFFDTRPARPDASVNRDCIVRTFQTRFTTEPIRLGGCGEDGLLAKTETVVLSLMNNIICCAGTYCRLYIIYTTKTIDTNYLRSACTTKKLMKNKKRQNDRFFFQPTSL